MEASLIVLAGSGVVGALVATVIRAIAARLRKTPPQDHVISAAAALADALARAAADRRITAAELTVLASKAAALLAALSTPEKK
jgi:ABC-type proline/glycine betaine transport system permease subunit